MQRSANENQFGLNKPADSGGDLARELSENQGRRRARCSIIGCVMFVFFGLFVSLPNGGQDKKGIIIIFLLSRHGYSTEAEFLAKQCTRIVITRPSLGLYSLKYRSSSVSIPAHSTTHLA